MLQIEASTPELTGNSSILPDIAEDLHPNKYTNNYTSPSENLLKTNEISSPNTTIEPLASNNQILDHSPETPPQPDIDTFILNKNPTPTTNNIPKHRKYPPLKPTQSQAIQPNQQLKITSLSTPAFSKQTKQVKLASITYQTEAGIKEN
jgi:hypothetical protein